MDTTEQTWVTVDQAAREVGISPTTIRDWYRSGAVATIAHPSGRVVDLDQVRSRAMGFAAPRPRHVNIKDRMHDGTAPDAPEGSTLEAELTINVGELQQLARQRLEA
jgi:transposase-like protein